MTLSKGAWLINDIWGSPATPHTLCHNPRVTWHGDKTDVLCVFPDREGLRDDCGAWLGRRTWARLLCGENRLRCTNWGITLRQAIGGEIFYYVAFNLHAYLVILSARLGFIGPTIRCSGPSDVAVTLWLVYNIHMYSNRPILIYFTGYRWSYFSSLTDKALWLRAQNSIESTNWNALIEYATIARGRKECTLIVCLVLVLDTIVWSVLT